MTLQDFIKKYNWRAIDYDGVWGAQCVDLVRQYIKEVLNAVQPPAVGDKGAAHLWDNYLPQHYDRFVNTLWAIPQPGDIVIWNRNTGGGHGHVAIIESASLMSFRAFSQNDPMGSYSHLRTYYYKNVIGWLRAKKTTPPPPPENPDDVKFNKIMALRDVPGSNTEKLQKIEKIIHE